MRKYIQENILKAKATTGVGTAKPVSDMMHMMILLSSQGTAAFTAKIQGSLQETQPDFSAAQTATNRWDYVACRDMDDPTAIITGSTGIAFTVDDVKQLELITTGLKFINVSVTAISAGSVNADLAGFSNE